MVSTRSARRTTNPTEEEVKQSNETAAATPRRKAKKPVEVADALVENKEVAVPKTPRTGRRNLKRENSTEAEEVALKKTPAIPSTRRTRSGGKVETEPVKEPVVPETIVEEVEKKVAKSASRTVRARKSSKLETETEKQIDAPGKIVDTPKSTPKFVPRTPRTRSNSKLDTEVDVKIINIPETVVEQKTPKATPKKAEKREIVVEETIATTPKKNVQTQKTPKATPKKDEQQEIVVEETEFVKTPKKKIKTPEVTPEPEVSPQKHTILEETETNEAVEEINEVSESSEEGDSDDDAPEEATSKKAPVTVEENQEFAEPIVQLESGFDKLMKKKEKEAEDKQAKIEKKKLAKKAKNLKKKKRTQKIAEGIYKARVKKSKTTFDIVSLKKGVQSVLEPEVNFREELLKSRTSNCRLPNTAHFLHRSKWVSHGN